LLSKTLIKALDLTMGEICDVRFALDDPNAVTLPPALTQALREDDALYALWQAQTPGKQRGLAHMVATAKTPPTQAKRLTTIRGILEGRLDPRGKPLA
ncbi:MAG: YdeI/OmpD-associated family protein, partial [Pseudomonadota bacterium]